MKEILEATFSLVNAPATLLVMLVGFYWLTVLLGALDIDSFDLPELDADFDFNVDVDTDVDLDNGMESDGDASGHGALWSLAEFLGLGNQPVMIPLTLFALLFWAISLNVNRIFNPEHSLLLGFGLMIPGVIVSAIGMKYLCIPFGKVYQRLEKARDADIANIGTLGKVSSLKLTAKSGQIEVQTASAPLLLNAKRIQDCDDIVKGSEVTIVGRDPETGAYTVKPVSF